MSPPLFRGLLISVHVLNIIGAIIWKNPAIFWFIFVLTIIGTQLKPRIVVPNNVYAVLSVTFIILIGIIEYGMYIGNWMSDPYAEISFPTLLFILLLFEPKTKKTLLTQPPTKSSNNTKD